MKKTGIAMPVTGLVDLALRYRAEAKSLHDKGAVGLAIQKTSQSIGVLSSLKILAEVGK